MEHTMLEFQGTGSRIVWLLLAGTSVVLLAWAIGQLTLRRRRRGAAGLAAAFGPAVFLPYLIGEGVWRIVRQGWAAGRDTILSATAGVIVVSLAGLWALTTQTSGAVLMALLLVQLLTAIAVIYSGAFAHLKWRRMSTLIGLRYLAIVVLVLLLFKPALLAMIDPDANKPLLTVAVDHSASMATRDAGQPPRLTQITEVLQHNLPTLQRHFRLRWISLAERANTLPSFEAIRSLTTDAPASQSTDLAAAIRLARQQGNTQQVAGVILLTDGNHNAADSPLQAARSAALPVFAVGVGDESTTTKQQANLAIASADMPMEVILNHTTEITVKARLTQFANTPCEVQLLEEGSDTPVVTQKLWTAESNALVTAKLKWTPRLAADNAGGRVRKLRIVLKPKPNETTTLDNAAELHVLLSDPKLRVLYVEGTMRPEYKYLKRILDTDPNIQFLGLIRVAQNRFWAQGSLDGKRLAALPASEADFKLFDVLILGDIDRSFWSNAQMTRIRTFVSDGGSMIMLGGRNSFGPGGYNNTPIGEILPVLLGGRGNQQLSTPFLPKLTSLGESHPMLRGMTDYFAGPSRLPSRKLTRLAPLRGCVQVGRGKPAAAVLMVHPTQKTDGTAMPILAIQRFGAGKTVAFTADTTWQWYLPTRGLGADSPYARFWGQMIRYLAGTDATQKETGSAAVLRASTQYFPLGSSEVQLFARIQRGNRQAAGAARVLCEIVHRPTAKATWKTIETISMGPTRGKGLYQGQFIPTRPGEYQLRLAATDSTGKPLGRDVLPLLAVQQNTETQQLSRNSTLLQKLATDTGGSYSQLTSLPELIENILDRQAELQTPSAQAKLTRLYHFPTLFLLFVALLTTEWLLRRSWNML